MRRALAELIVAVALIVVAVAVYPALARDGAMPGEAVPHGFGIVGVVLMLWAEVAHSLRRRSHGRALVPARHSLSAHVVAGLVGPALVFLHASDRFGGLAGVVTVMTLLVVASGLTGRLLYPTVGGRDAVRPVVATWHLLHVPLATATVALAAVHVVAALYFGVGVR